MTFLCVESTVVYADGVAAIAAEGGVNKTFEVTGTNSFATGVSGVTYNLGIVIRATVGEETSDDGDINIGAKMTGGFSSGADGTDIRNLRTNALQLLNAGNATIRRLIIDGNGNDAVTFNDTIDAEDIIAYNCDDGWLSSVVLSNSLINKCTVVGAGRFGYAQGKFNNCVDVNSSNQGYFNEAAGSTGTWENDGTGTNSITESPATDIFVDYAGGKYAVLDTSSPGAAGAGAFIFTASSGISVTGDTSAFDYNALAGTVDLTGEILVTGSTVSFDYTAINGSIDLTGQLLVTGQTANFDYNTINGAVEFTGEISVTGDTASFDYIALPGTIDLTGEIIVTGSTANFDYTGENGIVELGAVINVVGQTANFDFNGVNAEVSLTGEITIVGDTATFDYVAKSGVVVIGEGQKIGTVTAGFADSTIGVQYKQNTITVNFGE